MYEIFERLIREKGITAYRVSKDTGISQATLSEWRKGTYTPKIEKLQKIADYLEVDIDYLLGTPLSYCPLCGQGCNEDDPESVEYHKVEHKKWKAAVDAFGFCWPYKVRESIKHHSRRIVEDKSQNVTKRYYAALNILKAYFSRSLESNDYNLQHPDFHDYACMILAQKYMRDNFGSDVCYLLDDNYAPIDGMPRGTIYQLNKPSVEKSNITDGEKITNNLPITDKAAFELGIKIADHKLSDGERSLLIREYLKSIDADTPEMFQILSSLSKLDKDGVQYVWKSIKLSLADQDSRK